MIIPVVVVSVVGSFAAILPIDSSDRMNLVVTALLGFLFLQSVISELIPKSASIPMIAYYVLGALLISLFNLAGFGFVQFIYCRKSKHTISSVVDLIFIRLLGILLLHQVRKNIKVLRALLTRKKHEPPITPEKDSSQTIEENPVVANLFKFEQGKEAEVEESESWKELGLTLNKLITLISITLSIILIYIYLYPLFYLDLSRKF